MEIGKGLISNASALGKAKLKQDYEGCSRCLELYDKITSADDKCLRLDLDIWKKDSLILSLESKLGCMELEKLKLENEIVLLKQRNAELENHIQNLKEEDGKLTLLMIKNKVLECEKKKAKIDISSWKLKYKELEMKLMEMEKKLSVGSPLTVQTENNSDDDKVALGTPQNPINTPHKMDMEFERLKGGRECGFRSRVRNSLHYGLSGEGTPRPNMFPSIPGTRPPFVATIKISDSDDNDEPKNKNVEISTGVQLGVHPSEKGLENSLEPATDDEETTCYFMRPPMPKRQKVRRSPCVVNSESENDSDDNIPISRLMSKKSSANVSNAGNDSCSSDDLEKSTPRQRLRRARDTEEKGVLRNSKSALRKGEEDSEMETDESSDEESENLGGFIVSSSEEPGSESSEGPSSGDCSGNESNGGMGYGEVMSRIRRGRKWKMDWEYEADMLADLGKCSELCMKAVCAIYRRQTSEEQSSQATLVCNGRGFSQFHAQRGSALAEFLTDGNPDGDVNKTVEELRNFDSGGVEYCRKLAIHYSRQLFEIYKNREDRFFHP